MNTSTKFIPSKAEGLSTNGQKRFANILTVLVVVGLAIFAASFLWANFKNGNFGFNQNQQKKNEEKIENRKSNQEETSKVTEVYDNSHVKNLPSCQGNNLLTSSPMDLDKIPVIMPRGGISPPGHTVPSDHGGIMYPGAWEKFYSAEAEIKIPADGHIFRIERTLYSKNGVQDREDYEIAFSPCREVVLYMGHISTISSSLQKIIDLPQEHCEFHREQGMEYTFCTYPNVDYIAHSGEVIGTVKSDGTHVMGMDFGAFDTRSPELKFLGRHDLGARKLQTLHNVCPWDYYFSPLKEQLYDKLAAKVEPRCGVFMQDKDNTIAGNWQVRDKPQVNDGGSEWGKYFAIVHDNINPEISVIAFGGVVAPPGTIGFVPTHQGTINREPTEVGVDRKVYCYSTGEPGSLSNQKSSVHSGRMLIQLVDRLTLKAEFQEGSCNTNINFNSPTTYER